jgi:hypothetical protein
MKFANKNISLPPTLYSLSSSQWWFQIIFIAFINSSPFFLFFSTMLSLPIFRLSCGNDFSQAATTTAVVTTFSSYSSFWHSFFNTLFLNIFFSSLWWSNFRCFKWDIHNFACLYGKFHSIFILHHHNALFNRLWIKNIFWVLCCWCKMLCVCVNMKIK